jgi:anti-sigma regulatory factor (Ser/Thr protein kinase)
LSGVDPEAIEAAELLTSELVTNAIVHGSGDPILNVSVGGSRLRIEVHDSDPTIDLTPQRFDVPSARGRGLALVDALSSSWGVEPRSGGKAVWFDLDL